MKVTGARCEYCDDMIYFGSDCCMSIDDGIYFCDNDCANEYYTIKLHTLDELDLIDIFEGIH